MDNFYRIDCNTSTEKFVEDFQGALSAYDKGSLILFDDSMEGNIFNSSIYRHKEQTPFPEHWHPSRFFYANGDINLANNFKKEDHFFDNVISNPFALLDRTRFYFTRNKIAPAEPQYPELADRHFICMNGVPKPHRFTVIDEMHFNGSIQYGWFTWLERRMPTQKSTLSMGKSTWRGKITTLDLDGDTIENHLAQETPPKEYNRAFYDIALESIIDDRIVFYTEKTWKNILRKKLFLPLGSQYFVKGLHDLGFKLYEEIFNYNYDSLPYAPRIQAFVQELHRLNSLPLRELKQRYLRNKERIDAKLEYNYNLAMRLHGQQWGGEYDLDKEHFTMPPNLKPDRVSEEDYGK